MLSVQPKGKQKGCAGCNRKIKDRYLLKALDKYWHEDCLKCACCDCRLGEVGSTLYTKANLILCRRDYLRQDTHLTARPTHTHTHKRHVMTRAASCRRVEGVKQNVQNMWRWAGWEDSYLSVSSIFRPLDARCVSRPEAAGLFPALLAVLH